MRAVTAYAKIAGVEVVAEFYDAAVSPYTDFPLAEFSFWFANNNTIYPPSEQ